MYICICTYIYVCICPKFRKIFHVDPFLNLLTILCTLYTTKQLENASDRKTKTKKVSMEDLEVLQPSCKHNWVLSDKVALNISLFIEE